MHLGLTHNLSALMSDFLFYHSITCVRTRVNKASTTVGIESQSIFPTPEGFYFYLLVALLFTN